MRASSAVRLERLRNKAVSGGRAEVILGRGSFTESFPLFGYALDQYATLFEEKRPTTRTGRFLPATTKGQ